MEDITKYKDHIIILLRQLTNKKTVEIISENKIKVGNKDLSLQIVEIKNGISMMLPEIFLKMEDNIKYSKYLSRKRPELILTYDKKECVIINEIIKKDKKATQDKRDEILKHMNLIYPSFVFYDIGVVVGECCEVYWFDYKGFKLNGNFYGLTFLADLEDYRIVGSFQCRFVEYVEWKTAVLKLLQTIQMRNK